MICSHLHYDHAGNLKRFRHTRDGKHILISEAEAHEAFVKVSMSQNGVSGAYFRNEMIMEGIGYQTISENTRASDDVFLFIQREHTPGVIRMLVRTEENGNFLFVTEGIYSKLNFGPLVVLPGLCVDLRSYKANIDRVRSLSEEYDAIIVFGHDVKTMEIVTGVVSINMVEKDADKTGSRINGENWDVMAMATYGIGACHLS